MREYIGTGEIGDLAAALDAEERTEREEARIARRAEDARAREIVATLSELETITHQAIEVTLHSEGFHRVKRQWRRKRG
ncbi:MAG TPA: hypothetical protein VIK85_00470 [Coriobacteriia bacterium]